MDTENSQHQGGQAVDVFSPGDVIGGVCLVKDCLGVGSTTTVYLVSHNNFDKDIVLKLLKHDTSQDETAVVRFQRELFASYEVSHPNVIRSYELVRHEGLLGYTMEYASGGDLRRFLNKHKEHGVPTKDVVRITSQIAAGLSAIHESGIVHRDLKPANVFFGDNGEVRLLDFGIARIANARNLTKHGEVLGAIDYVSPEYIQSGEVDNRSDIYALGLISYEMVTGAPAFSGLRPMDVLLKRMTTDPEEPHRVRKDCPQELSRVIMKALRRDPDERFQSTTDLIDALAVVPDEPMRVSKDATVTIQRSEAMVAGVNEVQAQSFNNVNPAPSEPPASIIPEGIPRKKEDPSAIFERPVMRGDEAPAPQPPQGYTMDVPPRGAPAGGPGGGLQSNFSLQAARAESQRTAQQNAKSGPSMKLVFMMGFLLLTISGFAVLLLFGKDLAPGLMAQLNSMIEGKVKPIVSSVNQEIDASLNNEATGKSTPQADDSATTS